MDDRQDSELTPEEWAALRALPLEAAPPAHLEERVVAALRDRGLLRRPRARTFLRVAAAAALFVAGIGVGAALVRVPTPAPGPQFLLLLYPGPDFRPGALADEAARVQEYGAWAAELRRQGALVDAERLASEVRLLLGTGQAPAAPQGYFIVRATGVDEALAIARGCPHLRHGGQVVVQAIDPA